MPGLLSEGLHLLGASLGVMDDEVVLHHKPGNKGHKIEYGLMKEYGLWCGFIGL